MNFSRRQLEAAGLPLGGSATRIAPGTLGVRLLGGGGSGGGGSTTTESTVTNYSIPDWLQPQTEALMGAATQELFQVDGNGQIVGVKPFTPYSANPSDYVAPFSPLQQQVQHEAANMVSPGQFGPATDLAAVSGAGQLFTVNPALDYGALGAAYGDYGNQLGGLGMQFGQQGSAYGDLGALYGHSGYLGAQQAFDYGRLGIDYGGLGAQIGTGYAADARNPAMIAQYMSPYMQNVVDLQKEAAIRDATASNLVNNLAAPKQGTYGGARQILAQAEASRALQNQLANIQAAGTQKAYEDAQQAQQFAVNAGLQGVGAGLQGVGAGLQGVQTGLRGSELGMQGAQVGIQGAGLGIQGAQAGMQGAGLGIQGAQTGLQGVNTAQQGFNLAGQQATNLANIGTMQQQADLNRLQMQSGIGNQQQAQEQAKIDQAVQNYASAQDNAQAMLEAYSALLHGYASPTVTQDRYSPAPSTGSQMAGLGISGLALANMMGGMAKGGRVRKKKGQGIDALAIRRAMP